MELTGSHVCHLTSNVNFECFVKSVLQIHKWLIDVFVKIVDNNETLWSRQALIRHTILVIRYIQVHLLRVTEQ